MNLSDNKTLKAAAVLVSVAALSATIGIGVSAKMGSRGQDPVQGTGPGGQGMMGRGMGMRGGPGGMGGPGGGPLGFLGPGARELNLTDAQREKIRTIVQSHQEEMKAVGDRMAAARKALDDAITADTFDEAAIRAKASEVASVEGDAAVLRAKVHQEAWPVLTPEQQQKAKELKSQMPQRMRGGGGRGQGRGPGGMMQQMFDRFMHQPKPAQESDNQSEQESGRPEVV
jgi:Spy/CpxP family protein refolding chaperone